MLFGDADGINTVDVTLGCAAVVDDVAETLLVFVNVTELMDIVALKDPFTVVI